MRQIRLLVAGIVKIIFGIMFILPVAIISVIQMAGGAQEGECLIDIFCELLEDFTDRIAGN